MSGKSGNASSPPTPTLQVELANVGNGARRVVPPPRSSVGSRFSKRTLVGTLLNGRERRKRPFGCPVATSLSPIQTLPRRLVGNLKEAHRPAEVARLGSQRRP